MYNIQSNQKQVQKRATNPYGQAWSTAIQLRGVEPTHGTVEFPAFTFVVAAGGNSVTATLTSANADKFDYLIVTIEDQAGNSASAKYAGAPLVIDTTAVSKTSFFNGSVPDITISVKFRTTAGNTYKGENANLEAYIPFTSGAFVAGFTFNMLSRLDSDDRGQIINIEAEYTTGPDTLTVDIVSIASANLEVEIFEGATSLGTVTLDANGVGQLTDAGTRAPGSYVIKAVIISDGLAKDSFNTVTLTV
jgi:hypothetical protein